VLLCAPGRVDEPSDAQADSPDVGCVRVIAHDARWLCLHVQGVSGAHPMWVLLDEVWDGHELAAGGLARRVANLAGLVGGGAR